MKALYIHTDGSDYASAVVSALDRAANVCASGENADYHAFIGTGLNMREWVAADRVATSLGRPLHALHLFRYRLVCGPVTGEGGDVCPACFSRRTRQHGYEDETAEAAMETIFSVPEVDAGVALLLRAIDFTENAPSRTTLSTLTRDTFYIGEHLLVPVDGCPQCPPAHGRFDKHQYKALSRAVAEGSSNDAT